MSSTTDYKIDFTVSISLNGDENPELLSPV